MRRIIAALFALCLLLSAGYISAAEETSFEMIGKIHESIPDIHIRITHMSTDEMRERPNVLLVHITYADGHVQEFCYESLEIPGIPYIVPLVRMEDLNFDGYSDLVLLVAEGAANVYQTVAIWNNVQQSFISPETTCHWQRKTRSWSEPVQLEFCNYTLHPEQKVILSWDPDGHRFLRLTSYFWESKYSLLQGGVFERCEIDEKTFEEDLQLFYGTQLMHCWNDRYQANAFDAPNVFDERIDSALRLLVNGFNNPEIMFVSNVDWVNLRQAPDKSSKSLAHLDVGTAVNVLATDCGVDKGWTRVVLWPDDSTDPESIGMTGYIWHSYLAQ